MKKIPKNSRVFGTEDDFECLNNSGERKKVSELMNGKKHLFL